MFIITILNIIPIVIWTLMVPIGTRFSNLSQSLISLGQISGLLGLTLCATAIILSSRLRFIESRFSGLNRVLVKHHLLGSISFILLMFHPVALAMSFSISSLRSGALFLLPDLSNLPKTLGIVSLLIMMSLLTITFYLAIRYRVWKFSHRFLALAFFIGLLHTAAISSDVSRNLFLRSYVLSYAGLAVLAYTYRMLVEFGGWGKYRYSISSVSEMVPGVWEIGLMASGPTMKYHPGQFAFFSFHQSGVSREDHPFSIVSTPEEAELRLIIKNLGDFTASLDMLEIGSEVLVEGPYGAFGHERVSPEEIWIAGGIGITPFVGLSKELVRGNRAVDLYVSFKNREEAIGLDELSALATQAPKLRVFPYYTERAGFLTANAVVARSGGLSGKVVRICGPLAMMKSLRSQFVGLGLADKNIFTEEFSL